MGLPRGRSVLVFWSYFETRIERLFEKTATVPGKVMECLLDRHGVGARLDRIYKIVYSTTYWADLKDLGYGSVAEMLRKVQKSHNDFDAVSRKRSTMLSSRTW